MKVLRARFGDENIIVKVYSWADLHNAVKNREVDLFLSSAGFFTHMRPYGVHHVVSVTSTDYPDPNHSDGAAMVVAANREDLKDLEDLHWKTLITNTSTGFTGLQVPLGVIADAGYNPDYFFKHVVYLGGGSGLSDSFEHLLQHEADVAFVRLCYMEKWLEKHPSYRGRFRIINDLTEPNEACRRSTPLYPSWTIGSTMAVHPRLLREILKTLLQMPSTTESHLTWSVANDFSTIDTLFKHLKIGPYAYLREWNFTRIWREYSDVLTFLFLIIVGLILHSIRVGALVKKRTSELQRSLVRLQTLRHQARETSEKINKLEKLSSIGQLSSIFAHEMRQPLGAISLYTYALKKAVRSGNIDQARLLSILDKVETQTARADAIVTKVREWVKTENPQRERLTWRTSIELAVRELTNSDRYDTPLNVHIFSEKTFIADPFGMELVAFNLLKNALEASQANPTPYSRIDVIVSDENGFAVLTIRNRARKITDEEWHAVCNTGFTSKKDGLGLGLGIVRSVLEQHAGRLDVRRHDDGLEVTAKVPCLTIE